MSNLRFINVQLLKTKSFQKQKHLNKKYFKFPSVTTGSYKPEVGAAGLFVNISFQFELCLNMPFTPCNFKHFRFYLILCLRGWKFMYTFSKRRKFVSAKFSVLNSAMKVRVKLEFLQI
jgi:hypothetical protein